MYLAKLYYLLKQYNFMEQVLTSGGVSLPVLEKMVKILKRTKLVDVIVIKHLEDEIPETQQVELEYPDEFLDPLMSTLMKDPVIIPTSGISIDRSVILQWSKTSDQDPFNRKPLKEQDLQDDTELKQKIEAFCKNLTLLILLNLINSTRSLIFR